jgi:hypothetical protein
MLQHDMTQLSFRKLPRRDAVCIFVYWQDLGGGGSLILPSNPKTISRTEDCSILITIGWHLEAFFRIVMGAGLMYWLL